MAQWNQSSEEQGAREMRGEAIRAQTSQVLEAPLWGLDLP